MKRKKAKVSTKLGAQLLEIVQFLHTQSPPVIHKDIKPANLKLASDGRLFLLDFGLAKDMVHLKPKPHKKDPIDCRIGKGASALEDENNLQSARRLGVCQPYERYATVLA